MIKYLCKNASMSTSFTSKWFETSDKNISGKSIYNAVSIQVSWSDIIGTPNGTINLEFSNNQHSFTEGASINVDNTDNRNNAEIALISKISKFCRIRYTSNNITDGTLNAVLYLEEN